MKSLLAASSILLLVGCTASAKPDLESESSLVSAKMASAKTDCMMNLSMSDEGEISQWRTVLDGVMGGRSTGNRFAQDGHMTFKGRINTNGGGFSSIRRSMSHSGMKGAEALKLRVKQDGRSYRLTFRTSTQYRGRSISYQLPIPQTPVNKWAEVTVPLSNFRTSVFGYEVPAPPFAADDVREMGFILADGIDGLFQIDIAEISCVNPKAT